jgi:hypothetical protein
MPTSPPQQTNASEWRSLFRAAIVEKDLRLLEKRISNAEQAIVARTVELFRQTGIEVGVERELLNDALYILRARRSAIDNNTAA